MSDNIFKKNIDLAHINKKMKLDIPMLQEILTKKIAPLTDMYQVKKEKNDVKVPALNSENTSRKPDDKSDKSNVITSSKF